jgi:hypothetical protein
LITLVLGGAAGVVNAGLTGNLRLLPQAIRAHATGRIEAVQLGFLGNIAVGALASGACVFAVSGVACLAQPSALAEAGAGAAAAFIGFAAARWCTSGADTRLLRIAVCKASEAPAAHPDLVTAFETATPAAVYRAASDLMPRRARLH